MPPRLHRRKKAPLRKRRPPAATGIRKAAKEISKPLPPHRPAATASLQRRRDQNTPALEALQAQTPMSIEGAKIIVVHVTDAASKAVVLASFFKYCLPKGHGTSLVSKNLEAAPELLFWVPASNPAFLNDAAQAGRNAGGVLGFCATRSHHIGVRAILRSRHAHGKAHALVEVLKTMATDRGATIFVDAPPCLSRVTMDFWLSNLFNPSPEVLKLPALPDGRHEHVKTIENVRLYWECDANFLPELAREVRKKFSLCTMPRKHPRPMCPDTSCASKEHMVRTVSGMSSDRAVYVLSLIHI